jgi:hypothetical protein
MSSRRSARAWAPTSRASGCTPTPARPSGPKGKTPRRSPSATRSAEIGEALSNVGDKMQELEEVYELGSAALEFCRAVQGLDIDDPKSMEAFGEAAKGLGSAAKPFIDKAKSYLDKLVKAGEAGAEASIVLGYVVFMGQMFSKGVQAGLKVMSYYFAHQKEALRKAVGEECYDAGSNVRRPCRDDEL